MYIKGVGVWIGGGFEEAHICIAFIFIEMASEMASGALDTAST
jgi:hypothetical protein